MARIFITGSADGLGQLAAKALIKLGHQVVLHARNKERGNDAMQKVPGAEDVLIGDLSSIEQTKILASRANASGKFDAVIHNAGVYRVPMERVGAEGLPMTFSVNSLAPYILTCLIKKPQRLIYLSSGMHLHGNANMDRLATGRSLRTHHITYSDTKLHVVILTMTVARKWTDVYANAIDPGWVPTKMGGAGAPDDLQKGYQTQVWLAVSDDAKAQVSGCYFFHQKERYHNPEADEAAVQEKFLNLCSEITGISFPQ